MTKPAVLESRRLTLTPLRDGDARWLWPLLSDPVTMRAWPQPLDWSRIAAWIEGSREAEAAFGLGRHLLRSKESGTAVGDCGFFCWDWQGRAVVDAGWVIDHRCWRQGYALEAMEVLLAALFARGHREAFAKMAEDNVGSWRTAESLGGRRLPSFRYEPIRWGLMRLYRLEGPRGPLRQRIRSASQARCSGMKLETK